METADDVPNELRIFAKNFRKARKARDMTQADVSRAIGVDKSYISDIERCGANPTLATMAKLAGAIRTDLCDLLCDGANHAAPRCRPR